MSLLLIMYLQTDCGLKNDDCVKKKKEMKYCVWLMRWTSICLTIITAVDFLKRRAASVISGVHMCPEWYEINHACLKKKKKKTSSEGVSSSRPQTLSGFQKDVRLSVSVLYKSCVSVSISTHSLGSRFYVRNPDYLHSSCQKKKSYIWC